MDSTYPSQMRPASHQIENEDRETSLSTGNYVRMDQLIAGEKWHHRLPLFQCTPLLGDWHKQIIGEEKRK